ncbi:hypothetical protein AKJ43_02330 [candidate division MSBL1 archaeon SCGC-AAA261D19]|uniref:HTH asnC-type domain-containing protein n=1 Tax=candidate division MSBL1 archaeon SCGC-AAA261D19 TaxID=1698273 RepID=A0A133V6T7_9EURY|nr:hypothetical protein AKJ43_02330 [candidate division MSBL1 archaeon SCGC-AAA261D19]
MLNENARVSFRKMGEEVGLSTSGTIRRIKKLEDEGILEGYTAVINPERVGQSVTAFLNIDTKPGETGRVAGALSRSKEVCEIHRTTGSPDLIAKIRAENLSEVDEFVEERVGTYEGVRNVTAVVTMKTYKEQLWSPGV